MCFITFFNEFKGALTEQYVLQQFKCEGMMPIFYWSAETGTSETDFIIQIGSRVIPVEVKASENLRAKSLKIYRKSTYLKKVFVCPCQITEKRGGLSICRYMHFLYFQKYSQRKTCFNEIKLIFIYKFFEN
jgi:predicted AAA+ superfamily ATPase